MEVSQQQIIDPLNFFEELIHTPEGGQAFYNTFLPKEEIANGFIQEVDHIKRKKSCVYYDEEGIPELIEIDFIDDHLLPRLHQEFKLFKQEINQNSLRNPLNFKGGYLSVISLRLESFYKLVDKMKFEGIGDVLKWHLVTTHQHLENAYGIKTLIPNAISNPIKPVLSFRLIPKVSMEQLRSVFNDLNDALTLGFITSDADELCRLLTSKNVVSEGIKIDFSCKTTEASFIMKQLYPFFKNLNDTTIHNSKSFRTKQGHPLTKTNLSKSYKEFNDNKLRDKIKQIIADHLPLIR